MAKYFYHFKIQILNIKEYRFNTLLEVAFGNLEMFITILFWIVIYRSNNLQQVNSYELEETITYFILYSMTSKFVLSSSGFYFNDLIKNGKLSSILLKPYSVNVSTFFGGIADAVAECIPQLVFIIIIFPIMRNYISLSFNIVNFIFAILFLFISAVLSHLIWCIIGCMAFWVEEAIAIMWSVAVIFSFLSGEYLPLDFFPETILNVIENCPWSCFGYIPVKILLGHYSFEKMMMLVLIYLTWIVLFKILFDIVWKVGNKHFSAVGG